MTADAVHPELVVVPRPRPNGPSSKLTEKVQNFTKSTNKPTMVRNAFKFRNSGVLESRLVDAPGSKIEIPRAAINMLHTCQLLNILHVRTHANC